MGLHSSDMVVRLLREQTEDVKNRGLSMNWRKHGLRKVGTEFWTQQKTEQVEPISTNTRREGGRISQTRWHSTLFRLSDRCSGLSCLSQGMKGGVYMRKKMKKLRVHWRKKDWSSGNLRKKSESVKLRFHVGCAQSYQQKRRNRCFRW